MKRPIFFLMAMIILVSYGFGQHTEFKTHANGLMYSDTTMKQLKFIVDSLNLKFRACDLNKTYYAKQQAIAHYVHLEKGNLSRAKTDMEAGIPFKEFLKKYPKSKVEEALLVVRFSYQNYSGEDVVEFSSLLKEHEIIIADDKKPYIQPMLSEWLSGSASSGKSVFGFYFITEFQKKPLPEPYARMVQYADCMVDTTVQVFKEEAQRTGVRYDHDRPLQVAKFMSYVDEKTNKPKYDEDNSKEYWKEYEAWESQLFSLTDQKLARDAEFQKLLEKAVDEALKKGGSDEWFESFVGRYYSRKTELELKRGRVVVGGCSMDDSPRIHAREIAILSAETVSWEIFLRAHLDIMNDRFERVSDGSYAWAGRSTYIKELEELDINVIDLILGISLRVENPSQNHYYGSIGRLGRALAETENRAILEAKMLEMIEDETLDSYNRIILCYLFMNYSYHLKDDDTKTQGLKKLKKAIKSLPHYLAENFEIE